MKKLLILALFAMAAVAHAQNQYFVSNSGSDSNSGTSIGSPWQHISKAIASFNANVTGGAVINVAAGTYTEAASCAGNTPVVCINRGGASVTQRLVLRCSTKWSVPSSSGCLLRNNGGSNGAIEITVDNVDIGAFNQFGFDYSNGAAGYGIFLHCTASGSSCIGSNNVHVFGNYMHDIGQTIVDGQGGLGCPSAGGILSGVHGGANSVGVQVIGNRVSNFGLQSKAPRNGGTCNFAHGIYISSSGALIENNVVVQAITYGIQYYSAPCQGVISNNTVDQAGKGDLVLGGGDCSPLGHISVLDNIFEQAPSGAVSLGTGGGAPCSASSQILISRNVVPAGTAVTNGSLNACTTVSGTITEAPTTTFNGYSGTSTNNNYALKAGSAAILGGITSPCVSGGQTPCVPPNDFIAVARPLSGSQDVGAYVFSAAGVPIVSLTPSPLAFGAVAVSASSTLTATLANTGAANLTFSAASISGVNAADYSIVSTTCASPLTAGSSCTYSMKFTPAATGARNASLTLNDNASGSPHQLPLTGSGGSAGITLNPVSLSLGVATPGSCSASQTATITSTGTSALTISGGFTFDNPRFSFATGGTCAVQSYNPGTSCTTVVQFCPTVAGAVSGNLSIPSNAPGSPTLLPLTGTGGAPITSVAPSSGACGSVQVGASSTCQAFTLTNTGNINLTGIVISLTGVAAGSYSQSNNCPATLPASNACTITVFFQPTGSGTLNANLSVASNAAGSPSLTPVSGVGLTPATLTLSPSTVNFGNVVVNATSAATAITLANAGGSAATISSIVASTHFTQTNNCPASLAGGASCVISVTSTPVATGVLNGTLTVAASATGSPFVANLSVNGVAPVAVLAPSSINFGNQPNGSFSAPQSFSLSNTGTSTLTFTITKVGTNPGDFVVTTQCAGSLAPGASCPITVVFGPTTTGARSATVRITDNASGSPHDAAVSGTGIATAPAVCLNVNSVNFGNQPVSTSSGTQPVVVTNCGTANLVISAVTPTGNFSSTGCVTTVAVNATCTINGTFTPASAGAKTGQFSIASNAVSSPDLVTLSGFGTQTGATLTSTAAFGHVVVGVTSPLIFLTLTNTGNTSLNLNTPAITGSNPGDFSFGTSCGSSLAPNATCQLSATFIPTTTGARSATLTQSFTGGPTSVTSALSGTGDAATPAVTLTPSTLDFGSVTTGVQSAIKTVQVQNSGNAVLNITSITLTGTNAADYVRTNNCGATLAAGNVCTVDVTVTPGGTGARTANLHLIDDAADTPQNVAMTTNGVAAPAPAVSLSPASLSFSPPSIQTTTTSAAQNITATNTGNANLVVSAVTLSGANPGDFTISNNCSTVTAGNTCSATINCVPTAAGSRTATVSFASNAASSPDAAAISCTGFVGTPTILIAVSNINFGNQTVGTVSGPATFTLTNTGLATATSVAITTVGDFAVTDNCGGSITQGSSCSATVTFSPLVLCGQTDPNDPTVCISNVHLGIVRVVSNTSNSPQTVSLQGTAIPVAPPPGPIIMGVGGKITIGGRLTVN